MTLATSGIDNDIITGIMGRSAKDLLQAIRANPKDVRFADAVLVATAWFGEPRRTGGSHMVFKMPWPLDPRVNLQPDKSGKAKAYQIRQLVLAIDRMMAHRPGRKHDDG